MNYNKAIVVGRLTRDPEMRTLPNSGNSVTNFSLATSRFYSDQSGQKQEQTEFHNIVIFGKMAETASRFLNKGSLVLIEGRIQTRSWEDKTSGAKQYRTEIVADSMQLGPRQTGQQSESKSESIPVIEEKEEEINVEDIPF